jgi:NAD(P)H-nitrite reductase large subunit
MHRQAEWTLDGVNRLVITRTGDRRLDAVQTALSCGTGCGSCRIEVARLLVEAPATLAGTA